MFTGLVQEVGRIARVQDAPKGRELTVTTELPELVLGESIAVDGVCLTVARFDATSFVAFASSETLEKTTLGDVQAGKAVHLERAMRPVDRLGGHLVSGHVDGVGRVVAHTRVGDALEVTFEVPDALAPFMAPKGSVAIDGTSLTINRAQGNTLAVMLVPHTLAATDLGARAPGTRVNVEVDVLAKYVARLLGKPGVDGASAGGEGISLDLLARQGYL